MEENTQKEKRLRGKMDSVQLDVFSITTFLINKDLVGAPGRS